MYYAINFILEVVFPIVALIYCFEYLYYVYEETSEQSLSKRFGISVEYLRKIKTSLYKKENLFRREQKIITSDAEFELISEKEKQGIHVRSVSVPDGYKKQTKQQ